MSRTWGINYDTGTEVVAGRPSRPHFDAAEVAEDLGAIRSELHCTAVRITGASPDRLGVAAGLAIDLGLEVWLSPALHDTPPSRVLDVLADVATLAEEPSPQTPPLHGALSRPIRSFTRSNRRVRPRRTIPCGHPRQVTIQFR